MVLYSRQLNLTVLNKNPTLSKTMTFNRQNDLYLIFVFPTIFTYSILLRKNICVYSTLPHSFVDIILLWTKEDRVCIFITDIIKQTFSNYLMQTVQQDVFVRAKDKFVIKNYIFV
jgi:hypothetical protein